MGFGSMMEKYPWIEVQGRSIAKRLSFIKKIYKKLEGNKKNGIEKLEVVDTAILEIYLDGLGIQEGDILIVHSSFKPLKHFGVSPDQVIDMLLDRVGSSGTLVMPAFCAYDEKIKGGFEEKSEKELVYDVKNSPAWTGVISDKFWRREGTVRSRFPDNPLAAYGKYAEEMFKKENSGDLAHGKNSAWKFCSEHNAKVLFLGIPAFSAITEIHLAEDILDERWPVKGWFKDRSYQIIDGDHTYRKATRIRKQFWSKYATEYRCSYELRNQGLLKEEVVENVQISFIPNLKKLEAFVTERALQGDFMIYKIPSRYYKK